LAAALSKNKNCSRCLSAIARETGAQVVVLMPSVGGEKEITDYFKLFDYDIAKLKKAFDETH